MTNLYFNITGGGIWDSYDVSILSSVERYSLNGTRAMMNNMTTTRQSHGCSTIDKNNVTTVIVAGGGEGTITIFYQVFSCHNC